MGLNAYDALLGKADPHCSGNVGSNVPSRCTVNAVSGMPSMNPYDYLFTGLNAMAQKASNDMGPQVQQTRTQVANTINPQAAIELNEAKQRIARLEETLERREKAGLFTRIKCFLFGGEDC